MRIRDTPNNSFEIVSIDTMGPLRISNNYRHILTIQCELSKYVIATPTETKEAKNVARALLENCILTYGKFKILKSDRGTELANKLMNEICSILKIQQKFLAPFHHQSIGSLERNQFLMNICSLS